MAANLPPIGLRRVVYLEANRAPTILDTKYRDGSYYENNTEWRDNSTVPPTIWKLSKINSKTNATWFIVSSPTGNVTFLEDQVGAAANPAADGHISILGSTVASGANPSLIPLETVASLNTITAQVQVSKTVAAAPANKNDAGLASFNQGDFTVDANGWVSLIGATPFTWLVVTEMGTPASLVNNVGYICASNGVPSSLSFALPATSVLGDIVEIALNGATKWTITQAAGQQIRWSGSSTTLGTGGSLATTGTGDSVRLVCQVADTIWVGLSGNGNLTVT